MYIVLWPHKHEILLIHIGYYYYFSFSVKILVFLICLFFLKKCGWGYYLFLPSYVFVFLLFTSTTPSCANLPIHTYNLSINFILLKKVSQEPSDFTHLDQLKPSCFLGVLLSFWGFILCMRFPFSWIQDVCFLSFLVCFVRT